MCKADYAASISLIMPHAVTKLRLVVLEQPGHPISGGSIALDLRNLEAYLPLHYSRNLGMSKPPRQDPKSQALARDGALNPHPEAVRDALFTGNPFFDPRDLVQVRYEMVRRHDVEGMSISDVASSFGVSRPTFYKAQDMLAVSGLAGLVPRPRGPKGGHKISAEVVDFVTTLKDQQPELTTSQCVAAIEATFDVKVHRRSLERALARKKTSLAFPTR